MNKYETEYFKLQEQFIADAESKTDAELEKWIKALKDRKADAMLKKTRKLVMRGYTATEGMLAKMGYSEGDIAKDFDAIPYEVVKVTPDGDLKVETKHKYKLKEVPNFEDSFIVGMQSFLTGGHLKLSKTDASALNEQNGIISELQKEIATVQGSDIPDTEKYQKMISIKASLKDAVEVYDNLLDNVTIRYNAGKQYQEFSKEQKKIAKAALEDVTESELFTIALMNLKITHLQSVINKRILEKDTKLVNLAKKLIGRTYEMPKPSKKA